MRKAMNKGKGFWDKLYRKVHYFCFQKMGMEGSRIIYPSYWHYRLYKRKKILLEDQKPTFFLTAEPNKGAGIGHQIDGWAAGYLWAKQWNIPYAYSSFPDENWDKMLGFGESMISSEELIRKRHYKKRRLPYFKYGKEEETREICDIIYSYAGKKVVFFLELDQFCDFQHEAGEDFRRLFMNAKARNTDPKIYQDDNLSIALHIRRGDIANEQGCVLEKHRQRWLDNVYYIKVVEQIMEMLPEAEKKRIKIYLFSQGTIKDFQDFEIFENISYCLEYTAQDTFAALTKADILVTGKSSFSYNAALISSKIKICPENFWGKYPDGKEWILLDDTGGINGQNRERLLTLINETGK